MVPKRHLPLLLCLTLVALGLARSDGRLLPLRQEAYVWQRAWTAPVRAAVAGSADLAAGYRVLAAAFVGPGAPALPGIDWATLAGTGRPVTLVVRIEGQLRGPDSARVADTLAPLLARARVAGVDVAGVEVDHDCATARLPTYARLLEDLRPRLDVPLGITALPTWLGSAGYRQVAARADRVTLQIHAVLGPEHGLFDPTRARAWIDRAARETAVPLWVALPAYGTRVAWDKAGRLVSVESESPTLVGGELATELLAEPAEVASLLSSLHHTPPPGLAGIVWFRLPTTGDIRAWAPETWRAVAAGQPLRADPRVTARATDTPGLWHVVLSNVGTVDAPKPFVVNLPRSCTLADGANGYALDRAQLRLRREGRGLLRPGEHVVVGWMRCAGAVSDGELTLD